MNEMYVLSGLHNVFKYKKFLHMVHPCSPFFIPQTFDKSFFEPQHMKHFIKHHSFHSAILCMYPSIAQAVKARFCGNLVANFSTKKGFSKPEKN